MARTDDDAGAREHFEDAALYDFEYRRRRADVNFYRRSYRRGFETGYSEAFNRDARGYYR